MTKPTEVIKKKRLILLDSHAIIHRAYHALPDFASSKGEPTGALYGLSTMLFNIIKSLKPDFIVAAFDLPGPTYRHEAFKDYKAGRKKGDDALYAQINRSKDLFAAFDIPVYALPGFEADDMLGTIVHELKERDDVDIIIASGDMDTMQLIEGKRVQVYTLKKGIKDTIMYDEKAVKERFGFAPHYLPDYKGLRGDPSDNLPGVKGIGEKTGGALIAAYHTIEALYKALKKDKEAVMAKAGITDRIAEVLLAHEEEALFSKTLATIRHDAPIQFVFPEKTFKESLDMNKVKAFFDELEFKALADRLRVALGEADDMAREQMMVQKDIGYDPVLAEECMVMRWIVDTNILTPETDEILRFTKTETLKDAHAALLIELEKRNLLSVWNTIEKPLIPVLAQMKVLGIKLDIAYMQSLSQVYHKELKAIDVKIFEYAGHEFNIDSPKQLGEVIFNEMNLIAKRQKKTAGGALSTKESELQKIRELHPIVDLVLEHRELQKLLSTYIDVLPTLADDEGRVHTSLIQYGAATGRMASQHPNLQNIPIKSEKGRAIRKAFIAEQKYDMVAIDYSQMELRIAAFLSGDTKLIQIFREGQDVHTAVAAQVFKVDPKDVDKEMRRKAKVINFGILYGMGVTALKDNLGGTREEAQVFYNTYFETFTELAAYLERVKAETARKGYTETYFGRRRYIEGMNAKLPFIRSIAERAAINAPIQGTEADVIKLAMIKIHDWVKAEKTEHDVRMLLQVHDELLFEIAEGKAAHYVPKIREIMENIIDPKDVYDVRMTTEASVGKHWGDLQKMNNHS